MTAYEIAQRDARDGVSEIPGVENHPRILAAFDCCTYDPNNDETAWCSAMMNLWQHEAGNQITASAAARSWLEWGNKVTEPVEGDVVVLKRTSSPTAGHVTFFVQQIGDKIQCLGGNQGDAVKLSWYSTADVLGYRRA